MMLRRPGAPCAVILAIATWHATARAQPAASPTRPAEDDKPVPAAAPDHSQPTGDEGPSGTETTGDDKKKPDEAGATEDDKAPDKPAPVDDNKALARAHYDKGMKLYRQGAWAAALAEWLQSRQLYTTWSATSGAAVCLQKLQRFDEALDLFETLLREFSTVMPAAAKDAALRAVVELRGLVGTVDIKGAPVGAAVVIDGRNRGEYPLLASFRVAAGSHVVRVYKEGFEPFEERADVAGGQTVHVRARLQALVQSGRLRVIEQQNKVLDVIVDGNKVGATPWEGRLAVGHHVVVLRGPGTLGTQPVSAPVRLQEVTALSLVAQKLDASIRVVPTPAGASVAIDSVIVGHGVWEGRLHAGPHKIEVASEGFVATGRDVTLARDAHEILTIALQRDPSSPLWRKPGRFVVDAAGAIMITPSLGGDIAGGCSDPCTASPGVGGYGIFHGGYELGSGFGFGLAAGYLTVRQTLTGRSTSIRAEGRLCDGKPCAGTAEDTLDLHGFVAGAWAALSFGERFPIRIRLGGGALLGSASDTRTGTFTASSPMVPPYHVGPVGVIASAPFVYVDPELRAGIALAERFELSVGLDVMMLIALSRPRWDPNLAVDASDDGIGKFSDETLAGAFVALVAPSVGARYAF